MSKLRLDLKVYIDKYGNQYNNGVKNILYPIYKLSNNVYRLHLVTETSISNVSVFFEKADGSITTAYPMSHIGSEEVDGNLWSVYAYDIEDNVLDISERTGNNTLSFSFRQGTTRSVLNTQPVSVKCSYSINGELPTLEASDYDRLMSSINLSLISRNTNKVFHTTFLPEIIEDEQSDYYNINYVYILDGKYTAINSVPNTPSENVAYLWTGDTRITEPLLEKDQFYRWRDSKWNKLENFKKQIGCGYRIVSGGYRQIIYGLDYIDNKFLEIETNLTEYIDGLIKTYSEKLETLEHNFENHVSEFNDFVSYVEQLNREVIQTTKELATSNKGKIDTINETLLDKANITYINEENAKLDAKIDLNNETINNKVDTQKEELDNKIKSKSSIYFVTWEE